MHLHELLRRKDIKEAIESATPGLYSWTGKVRTGWPSLWTNGLQVAASSKEYSQVARAFPYVLQFELQRRRPDASASPWLALKAPQICQGLGRPDVDTARAQEILSDAQAFVQTYQSLDCPSAAEQTRLGEVAYRLAKLDWLDCTGYVDPNPDQVNPVAVKELVDMLSIVPFDSLIPDTPLLLGPAVGPNGAVVCGPDLLCGDRLVKVVCSAVQFIRWSAYENLVAGFILARHRHRHDRAFPRVERAALYGACQGCLVELRTDRWMKREAFAALEKVVIEKSQEFLQASAAPPLAVASSL